MPLLFSKFPDLVRELECIAEIFERILRLKMMVINDFPDIIVDFS